MKLKNYQKTAVDKLLTLSKKLLDKDGARVCVFKAPTGSGKTIMVADWLDQLAQEKLHKEYAFIWISGNNLHKQSKEKLETYLENSRYTFSYLDEIHDDAFGENEVVFVNWHSLVKKKNGEWDNVLMRDNERDRNLPTFVRNTKDEGREIILIVDESHYHYWSDQSQELIQNVIGPKLTVEVSATPNLEPSVEDVSNGDAGMVSIKFDDVVAEGMVKKEVFVNKEIGAGINTDISANTAILAHAIKKQKELKKLYKSLNSDINPLVLVQLPSESPKTSALDNTVLEFVEKTLKDEHDISVENGKLAVWLSDRKDNLAMVEERDNKAVVMIFKQAIAMGWDCPRAQILVMLRDIKSETFEIQTVGRIMRMPEAKHYNIDAMDRAYVYTNVEKVLIKQDDLVSLEYFKTQSAQRIDSYKNIDLPSIYLSRIDYGDLTLAFRKAFIYEANKRFGIKKRDDVRTAYKKADVDLELYPEELTRAVISDAVIANIDDAKEIVGSSVEFAVQADDIKEQFVRFAKVMSLPFAPIRSHTKIQQAFYDWFDNFLGYGHQSRIEVQRVVVCSEVNQKIFKEIIENAKEHYRKIKNEELKEKKREKESPWNVPSVDYFNELHEKYSVQNYVLEPCYLRRDRLQPERTFEDLLNANDEIMWWYKNGEKKESYFAIPFFDDHDIQRAFYPDYIVMKKDGSIGIFDTKSGMTVTSDDTQRKSNALQAYINENKKKKLFGGIVTFEKTGMKLFSEEKYDPDVKTDKWKKISKI